jgi:uncharacterized protein YndB with AHSA1/START domain
MSSTVHAEIEIAAPPTVVFDTVMDPGRLADWVTIHRSVTLISGDALSEGARMDQVLHIRGVSFKVHWTLVAVTRPREAEWLGRGPAMSHALIRYRLVGEADGPTKFAYTNEFSAPGGRIGNLASHVVVGHAPEREAYDSLMKLKSLLEER